MSSPMNLPVSLKYHESRYYLDLYQDIVPTLSGLQDDHYLDRRSPRMERYSAPLLEAAP